jgi:diguanylate cyclase (GGDEF)-like protein
MFLALSGSNLCPESAMGVTVKLFNRDDASLAVGLIAGALIVFQQPLRHLLTVAQDVETRYHVDLIPALTVLTVVLVFHQYRKRQQANAGAMTAAAETVQVRARSEELERLVTFGRALANTLDASALQQVLWQYVPKFAGEREAWLATRPNGLWEILLQDAGTSARRPAESLEAFASEALSESVREDAHAEGIDVREFVCFPMAVAGYPVGVMGIRGTPALSEGERKALGAVAALVAISVRNIQLFAEIKDHGLRDGLTGCFNRSHAMETLEAELRRAQRARRPLSVVMFDIDRFKSVNDAYGHLCGDALLAAVGNHLTEVLRTSDLKCRYGGDEFLVILPETPTAGAEQVAESLRQEIAKIVLSVVDRTPSVTASLGVASAQPGETDPAALLARADEALYRAKQAGRNRVCVGSPAGATIPAAVLAEWAQMSRQEKSVIAPGTLVFAEAGHNGRSLLSSCTSSPVY